MSTKEPTGSTNNTKENEMATTPRKTTNAKTDAAGRRVTKKGEPKLASYAEKTITPVMQDFADFITEETGYKVQVGKLIGIHSRVIPGSRRLNTDSKEPLHALRIVYRARITGGRLRDEKNGSTDRAEWFSLAQVRTLQRVKLVDIAIRFAGLS